MMLCATVAEAKQRMTYAEALRWMAYRAKTGPLDTGGKLETHLASVQAMIVQAMGGEATPADFLRRGGDDEPQATPDQKGIDMDQAMSAFKLTGAI
jgi:hypothetical protein